MTYIFMVERSNGQNFALTNPGPWLPDEAEILLDEELLPVEDQPGMWGTADGHTTVTRYAPKPVGSLPEDHGKVGDPVPVGAA